MAIIIGRVLDVMVSARTAALVYWQRQYVAIRPRRGCAQAGGSQRCPRRGPREGPKIPVVVPGSSARRAGHLRRGILILR